MYLWFLGIEISQRENIFGSDCLRYDYVTYSEGFCVYTLVENDLCMELLSIVISMGEINMKGLYTNHVRIVGNCFKSLPH